MFIFFRWVDVYFVGYSSIHHRKLNSDPNGKHLFPLDSNPRPLGLWQHRLPGEQSRSLAPEPLWHKNTLNCFVYACQAPIKTPHAGQLCTFQLHIIFFLRSADVYIVGDSSIYHQKLISLRLIDNVSLLLAISHAHIGTNMHVSKTSEFKINTVNHRLCNWNHLFASN